MSPERSASEVVLRREDKTAPQMGDGGLDHIGVCIPTYKRPHLLGQLLGMLGRQKSDGLFRHSVHVIDNDYARSAEKTAAEFACTAPCSVTYDVESVQNISLARNRAIRCASGNFLAFIDDDELPPENWLLTLYQARSKYRAAGVLGPVRPLFGPDSPLWLIRSRLCERPSYKNGTVLKADQTRTGNVLLNRDILNQVETPFSPSKGRTGGEDVEFFRSLIDRGNSFVWCEDAPVFEHIPPARCCKQFYLATAFRRGSLTGEWLRTNPGLWLATVRSMGAILAHTAVAGAGLVCGEHIWIRHAASIAWHAGQLSGTLGHSTRDRQAD